MKQSKNSRILFGAIILLVFSLGLARNDSILLDPLIETKNIIQGSLKLKAHKLPVFHLEVEPSSYQELISNLPESGYEYVDANFKLPNGEETTADVRFRGGTFWHWQYPKKSWRVKIKKDGESQIINFVNPRHKSHLLYNLGYYFGRSADLLTPDTKYVSLYVNGNYEGVYNSIEQTNQNFLSNRDREPGAIFYAEAPNDIMVPLDIPYGAFGDSQYWDYSPADKDRQDSDYQKLEALISASIAEPSLANKQDLESLVDVPATLRYIAILNLIGSRHISNRVNLKLYLNPITQKFEPIVWDVFIWFTPVVDLPITDSANSLMIQLLRYPEYVEQKNQYLWKLTQEYGDPDKIREFTNQTINAIKTDLELDSKKDYIDKNIGSSSHYRRPLSISGWLERIDQIYDWYEDRHQFVVRKLIEPELEATYNQSEKKLKLYLNGEVPVKIIEPNELAGPTYYPDFQSESFKLNLENVNSPISHKLSSSQVEYELSLQSDVNQITILNTITGAQHQVPVNLQ